MGLKSFHFIYNENLLAVDSRHVQLLSIRNRPDVR